MWLYMEGAGVKDDDDGSEGSTASASWGRSRVEEMYRAKRAVAFKVVLVLVAHLDAARPANSAVWTARKSIVCLCKFCA